MRLVSSQQARKKKEKKNQKIKKEEGSQSIQSIINSPLLYYISLNESLNLFIFCFGALLEVKFLRIMIRIAFFFYFFKRDTRRAHLLDCV
jgi:hypothetical protein